MQAVPRRQTCNPPLLLFTEPEKTFFMSMLQNPIRKLRMVYLYFKLYTYFSPSLKPWDHIPKLPTAMYSLYADVSTAMYVKLVSLSLPCRVEHGLTSQTVPLQKGM